MRDLGPALQNGRQILPRQLVSGNGGKGLERRLCRVPGQHADLAEMIARTNAEELDFALGRNGRQ
jgi:hypothetical protein